jgi:hypothetical protein
LLLVAFVQLRQMVPCAAKKEQLNVPIAAITKALEVQLIHAIENLKRFQRAPSDRRRAECCTKTMAEAARVGVAARGASCPPGDCPNFARRTPYRGFAPLA